MAKAKEQIIWQYKDAQNKINLTFHDAVFPTCKGDAEAIAGIETEFGILLDAVVIFTRDSAAARETFLKEVEEQP